MEMKIPSLKLGVEKIFVVDYICHVSKFLILSPDAFNP